MKKNCPGQTTMMNYTNSDFRSETIQEKLDNSQGFVEKWALSIFILLIVLLLSGTSFIMYPDIIVTKATVIADNTSKEIVSRHYYAQINLPQGNLDKIDMEESVQLRFTAYPYEEFGFVKGKFLHVSKLLSDGEFVANIELPEGLVTNYKKEIIYQNGLQANAVIITHNMSLVQKFYFDIRKGMRR